MDSTLCIPIVLKDVSPAVSENLKPLNNVLIGASRGPPGKFFKDELALELISALRIGGSCARVDFEESGGELQAHFQRFRTRLRAGELV